MERSVVKVSVFLTLGILISSKFPLKTIYCFILIISSLIMLLFFKKTILKKILIYFIYFNIGIILLNIKNKEDIFFDYNAVNTRRDGRIGAHIGQGGCEGAFRKRPMGLGRGQTVPNWGRLLPPGSRKRPRSCR